MKVSTYDGTNPWDMQYADREVDVKNLRELTDKVLCIKVWSPATFEKKPGEVHKNRRHRKSDNAISMNFIGIDIDSGMTITEAQKIIEKHGYAAVIATTRNHQKEKITGKGKVLPACDRFRVVLRLKEEIFTDADYKATFKKAANLFPSIDQTTKDISRFFYPCKKVIKRYSGKLFAPAKAVPVEKKTKPSEPKRTQATSAVAKDGSQEKGLMSNSSKDFIKNGAPDGEWHKNLFKAAADLKEQLYTDDEILQMLSVNHVLDAEDLRQLRNISKRPPRYPPRRPGIPANAKSESGSELMYEKKSIETRKTDLINERRIREAALANSVPFVCDEFDEVFRLTGINCLGSTTGDGKSTAEANALAHYLLHKQKTALVITNEDSADDISSRVACIQLKMSWYHYRQKKLTREETKVIDRAAESLAAHIEIVRLNANKLDMTRLEHVQTVLNHVGKHCDEYGLVVLDYLQTITKSDEIAETYRISKAFGEFLRKYSSNVPIPVLVLAQLKPSKPGEDFASRIQNDKTFANECNGNIELVADKDEMTSTFIVHKDRFSVSENNIREIKLNFVDGRYEPYVEIEGWSRTPRKLKRASLVETDDHGFGSGN